MDCVTGSIDITPSKPVSMGGWMGYRESSSAIGSRIEGNIVVLRDKDAVAFVSIDALYVGALLRNALQKVAQNYGLSDRNLIVGASHTHFAPMLDTSKPNLGRADPEHVDWVIDKLCALLERTLSSVFVPVELRHSLGKDKFAVSRRSNHWRITKYGIQKKCVSAPNLSATEAEAVHLITVRSVTGAVMAVIWSAACHPVGWPNREQISADFPGDVRTSLRQQLGKSVPVVFLQGCSGDLRPWTEPLRAPFRLGSWLRQEYFKIHLTFPIYKKWSEKICKLASKVFNTCELGTPINGSIRSLKSLIPLELIFNGVDSTNNLGVNIVFIGNGLVIIGASCELPVAVRHLMEQAFPNLCVLPIGCLDDSFGYFPSTKMLIEGGYEVNGWLSVFGLPWKVRLDCDPDQIFNAALNKLVES